MDKDLIVAMWLDAAGGAVADERDRELADLAAAWAARHWRRNPRGLGYVYDRSGLEFLIQAAGLGDSLVVLIRVGEVGYWRMHARYPVGDLGQVLDFLAVEHLLPARFSTLGRRALEGHAKVCQEFAEVLAHSARTMGHSGPVDGLLPLNAQEYALAASIWAEAAASAGRYARAAFALVDTFPPAEPAAA